MCISLLFDIVLLRIIYYLVSCNPEYGRLTCSKMSLMWQNFHFQSYYYVNFLISQYLPCDLKITIARVIINTVLFYTTVFFSAFESIYLKYIKSLQSGWKFEPSISNDVWPHVFRSEVGLYFPYFWLRIWLIFCFFLYVTIFHLLRRREGIGIYCKLITYWIESNLSRILLPAQYRTKFEILLGEVFQKLHKVIRQTASLYIVS